MSSALEQTTPSVPAASAALGRALYDSDATAKLRADAANAAERMAFPDSRRMRPWKYLDVSGLNLDGYQPGLGAAEKAPAAELRARYGVGETAALLVQSNSETVVTESGEAITLADFADADLAGRGLIEKHLNLGIPYARSKFTALHYAYLRGGVLVNVAANAEPKLPVRIVRDYQAGKQIAAPHTLIVTGTNSRVSIVEDFRSSEEDIVVLPVVEIVPGAGSEVRYTVLHRWGTQTQVFTEQRFLGARDAAFIGFNFVTSGKVVKGHVQCSLEKRGSSSELFGLTLGDEHQHVDFYTLQDHIAPDTRSDLLYKSALTDSAKSVYYGLTRVGLEAHNADANQENRNLLLSDDSKAESDPVLEILTNQVIRASHGATVGPVDQEQLYYMETRGIPPHAAEALLVRAFLGQVFDRIPDEFLHEELGAVLDAKLEKKR
jgi:Fe-S cluster assembly protein SufD